MSDNYLLNMYEKALKLPAGRKLFSMVFSRKAPTSPLLPRSSANFAPIFVR